MITMIIKISEQTETDSSSDSSSSLGKIESDSDSSSYDDEEPITPPRKYNVECECNYMFL